MDWRDLSRGTSSGAKIRIEEIDLSEGAKLGYIYDFGKNIQHTITLEEISKPEGTRIEGAKYPISASDFQEHEKEEQASKEEKYTYMKSV